MGFILSKIWGRESTSQQIEKIQKEIVSIQDFKRDTKAKQDKITKRLNISFSILYALAIILGLIYAKFYYHNPHKNMDFLFKFKIFLGFGLAPMTFIFLKRGLSWWFTRRLNKNEVKLKELREKKSKILDEVTEKETFKVAREILEKYAPESLSKYGMVSGYGMSSRNTSAPSSSSSYSGRSSYSSYSSDSSGSTSLRHRIVPGSSKSVIPSTFSTTPSTSTTSSSSIFSSRAPSTVTSTSTSGYSSRSSIQPSRPTVGMGGPSHQPPRPMSMHGPVRPRAPGPRPMMRPMAPQNRMPMGPPLPRPVVPTQKGFLGKIVDYVVGDGPGNRYALICNQCQSHNGMAQEEDYEYTSYRCCYCHYWNPPKKNKPMAPKLVLPSPEASKKEEKVEETKKDTENSKSTEESKEESTLPKEEPAPSSSSEDSKRESDVSRDSASGNELTKPESEDPVLVESFQVSNANATDKEDNVSESEAQVNKGSELNETEEGNASESKSDSDSDIDIIDEQEALEAMEIDKMNKSNLETNDKAPELKKEE